MSARLISVTNSSFIFLLIVPRYTSQASTRSRDPIYDFVLHVTLDISLYVTPHIGKLFRDVSRLK